MIRDFFLMLRAFFRQSTQPSRNALAVPMLREEIVAAAQEIATTRRATGVLMAHAKREQERLESARAKHADLESRAVAALQAGQESLAREAADSLLLIEQDMAALTTSMTTYAQEEQRLRETLRTSEARLRALHRGAQVAQARALEHRIDNPSDPQQASLERAEERLRDIEHHQHMQRATNAAVRELSQAQPDAVRDKLADAGFGPSTQPSVDDVMARLRAQVLVPDRARITTA